MSELVVLCWLWSQKGGRTKYTATHVNIWAAMVARNLNMPHRIACVTDMPQGIDPRIVIIPPPGEFVGIETPTWHGKKPNCFRRLAMFRSDAAAVFGDRFVCMDLDCVILGSLDAVLSRKEDIVLFKGTRPGRPYNGSMILMNAGARTEVYEDFSEAGAIESGSRFAGSDQAWICHRLGDREATWSESDGVYFWGPRYQRDRRLKIAPRILFFPGPIKPWNAMHIDRLVGVHYRRDPLPAKRAA